MPNLTPWLEQKFFLADGVTPNAGGKVFTYYPGTSTKKPTYAGESAAYNTNPIILDASGGCNIWFADGGYKVVNAPANDTDPPAAAIKTWDNINVSGTGGEGAGTVSSIAALRALTEGAFDTVDVLGYYSANGVGAGLFSWDATNTGSDNGGSIIAPTISDGTGRWILIQDAPLSVTQFGAAGNGIADDYAAELAAVAAVAVGGGTIRYPIGTYVTNSNLTVPANVRVVMDKGAMISVAATKTVTFNGDFSAGNYQVFTGAGVVAFGGSVIPVFNVLWWGALADSTVDGAVATDCSAPITAMFNVMTAITAPTECDFPASNGFYGCTTPVFIGKSNITIRGHRDAKSPQSIGGSVRFTASGSALDFFKIEGSYNRIVDMGIFGNNTTGAVVKLTNNFKTRLERCSISNRQENLGIVSGAGYIFNGTGIYFAGDGSTYANGESGMEDCYIRGCNYGAVMDWGADGYMVKNIVVDCYTACIYSAASSGGWLISGNKCYNSTASSVKLKYVAYLGGFAFGKCFENEWEMTDADPVSGAAYCIGAYIKTGGQEGSVFSDNLIYTATDNGHHVIVECTNANDQLTMHHNYCGAKVGKVNTVAFDFTGSFNGKIDCDDNFAHDCTTQYTTATAFWTVRRSDVAANGWTFSKDNLAGAAKLVALSTSVTNATGNLFGIEQTVSATDTSAAFGYTFNAIRGLVNLIFNIASAYNARVGQFVATITGAFGTTGSVYGSYNQISDSRSGGTSSEYDAVGGLINITGSGAVTLARAFYSLLSFGSSSAAVTTWENFEADSPIRSGGTHTITNAYGFRSKAQKQSFVTNGYGFYQEGASDVNQFEGVVKALSSVKSTSPTAGMGYDVGAGGTVTQATDKTTLVTLSKVSGQITMNAAALAANTPVSFTLTNTAIAATDILVMNHVSGGTAGAYTLNAQCAAGSAVITVRNVTTGSLSEAIVIGFVLVKGVIA